ncbi:hypothetical protein FPV67DRAFT_1008890 [Lyophyllum atratum]|nr:hypothetical protein FPV67DRAFT_1008890 [Lyophyllum atratum]
MASSPLPIEALIDLHHYTTITRYLSAAGLMLLVYDHILTISPEISLIWKSRPSFTKYVFLLNRYLVPAALLLVAYEMNGFSDSHLTDQGCRYTIGTVAIMSVISVAMANVLVLLHIVTLWDGNPNVAALMGGGFAISFCATLILMLLALSRLWSAISYSPFLSMCVISRTSPLLVAVWSSPALFEILVLTSTAWNAISRPRNAQLPLVRALHRDGLTFFMALTILRMVNLSLAITFRPELVLLAVFFVWSMTTLVLNRSLLRLKRARLLNEVQGEFESKALDTRALSPFGVRPRLQADALLEQPDFEMYELDEQNIATHLAHSRSGSDTKSRKSLSDRC